MIDPLGLVNEKTPRAPEFRRTCPNFRRQILTSKVDPCTERVKRRCQNTLLCAITKTLPRKPATPWMTREIMKAETLRHNIKRAWRSSCTHLDRSRYKHQCHLCNRLMTD